MYKHDRVDNVTGYSSSPSPKDIGEIHDVVLIAALVARALRRGKLEHCYQTSKVCFPYIPPEGLDSS